MKTSAVIKLTALLLAGSTCLCGIAKAEPQARKKAQSRTVLQDDEERYVYVTGSHIRQRVKLRSIGTTTPYNLRIMTKDELDSTGRFGVSGLALDPAITITGR